MPTIDPTPSNPIRRHRRAFARLALLAASLGLPAAGLSIHDCGAAYQTVIAGGATKAMDYRSLTGATEIGFRSSALMPGAEGTARVHARPGAMAIKASFRRLEPANRFGPEFMTYVLWAVTPAGRAANLGEVIVKKNGRARLEAHTNLQTFGLIVTAEPHFAVSRVSNLVVLENTLTRATRGRVEELQARCDLLPRESYRLQGTPGELQPADLDRWVDPYVYQAHNAVRIARAEEAGRYAPEAFQKAHTTLALLQAEKKKWKRPAILLARQAVQEAEDARLIAVEKREQARLEQEHLEAEQARREAEAARQESESARAQAERAQEQAADEARAAREQAAVEARTAKEQAVREVSAEKLLLRRKLREQLGRLLETRETDRGLVISLSDLLFPTGRAGLQPATREKLAKVAGILLAYPGLKVRVEGHADSTGRPAFNGKLAAARAEAVKAFLARQGFAAGAVTAEGLGSDRPIASNSTAAGRQQNRRVELILAGPPIGY